MTTLAHAFGQTTMTAAGKLLSLSPVIAVTAFVLYSLSQLAQTAGL